MKILVVTSSLPYPTLSGAKVRVWNLLKEVNRSHEVTLLSLDDSPDLSRWMAGLEACCTRLELVKKQKGRSRKRLLRQTLMTMAKGQPPQNALSYYPELGARLQELVSEEQYDIVHFEDSHMATYVEAVPRGYPAVRVVTMYNVTATQFASILKTRLSLTNHFWALFNWWFLHHGEAGYLAEKYDLCITVSEEDARSYRNANRDLKVVTVPNGVDTENKALLQPPNGSKDIVFVGKMNYEPNVDAAEYFCKEIFPLVQRSVPDARFVIVGSEPLSSVKALAQNPAVIVTGCVDDVVPYYRDARLSVAPIRAGSGTRLKILESLALGRPVVSTTIGCEGLAVENDENILIADSPADIAAQTVRLLSDDALCQRLIAGGRTLVERKYDWRLISRELIDIYESIAPNSAAKKAEQ